MGYLKVYTAKTVEGKYPNSMANAVHFAYSEDGIHYENLNQGYGILYAKAKIRSNNTIDERGILHPMIAEMGNEFLIWAEVVDKDGVSCREYCGWKTTDFIEFTEAFAIEGTEASVTDIPTILTADNLKDISKSEIEISSQRADKMCRHWLQLRAVSATIELGTPAEQGGSLKLTTLEELNRQKATVTFSDGSKADKKVQWDIAGAVKTKDKQYLVKGKVLPDETGFPLVVGFADPVLFQWEGKWYFLATNDNVNDIGMFVREADTVEKLFREDTEVHCILDYDEERQLCQTFWAPEFHVIGDDLYILFAVSSKQWGPQCHMMRLKKGGSIVRAEDWENPIRVRRMDGSFLVEKGISLDMTYLKVAGKAYVCWSERYGIGTPLDSGSMLCIATIDDKEPWKLTSEPVLLSRPLFGWENNSGTINNEGPYALILDDTIYLAYSGGDACGYYYVVGYLTAKVGDDLLDIRSWKKLPAPVFHSGSVEGIQGPGHNSFYRDEEGRLMIAYHGQEREKYFVRCSAMHPVHISAEGFPLLNVAGDAVLPEEMREVEAVVEIVG